MKEHAQITSRIPQRQVYIAVLTLVVAALTFIVAFAVGKRDRLAHAQGQQSTIPSLPQPSTSPTPNVPLPVGSTLMQTVRFTLYDVGIYPREIHVKKGSIVISIEDLSGGSSGLQVNILRNDVSRNVSVAIGNIQQARGFSRGKSKFTLDAGEYDISDISHPANHARLIVDP